MHREKSPHPGSSPKTPPTAEEVQRWLILQVAEELQVDPAGIRIDRPVLSHGIDSMQVVSIVARMEDWLDIRFTGNPLEDHSTIEQLSQHVAELTSK